MFELKIREIRLKKNITQEELALRSGISQGYIAYLERENISRDKSPRLETIEKIAKGMNVCPCLLLGCPCRSNENKNKG